MEIFRSQSFSPVRFPASVLPDAIKIADENDAHQLLNKLVSDNIIVNKFEIKKPTLNDIFIEKVGE